MIREGMPADDVLKMKGRAKKFQTKRVVVQEKPLIVEWHYEDIIITFKRWLNKYRVAEVKDID